MEGKKKLTTFRTKFYGSRGFPQQTESTHADRHRPNLHLKQSPQFRKALCAPSQVDPYVQVKYAFWMLATTTMPKQPRERNGTPEIATFQKMRSHLRSMFNMIQHNSRNNIKTVS